MSVYFMSYQTISGSHDSVATIILIFVDDQNDLEKLRNLVEIVPPGKYWLPAHCFPWISYQVHFV